METPEGYQNLGFMNDWYHDPPMIIQNCTCVCHRQHDWERCQALVWCDNCKYFYRIDSSD